MTPFVNTDLENIYDKIAEGNLNNSNVLAALQTFDGFLNYLYTGPVFLDGDLTEIADGDYTSYMLFLGGTFYNPNNVPVFIIFYNTSVAERAAIYTLMIPALGQVVLDAQTTYFSTTTKIYAVASQAYDSEVAPTLAVLASNLKVKINS